MCQYVIELTGLTKKYGDFTAVNDLNLQIRKGEIFGLLGPNGAGKSTTILMMLGLTEPTTGSVKVCDIDSTTHPIEVKRKVGYLPEDVGFYEDMTGIENLVYTAALNGIRRKEARAKAERLLDRIGLVKEADKKAGKYSKGMRQRLGLADVLIKSPEVIILDEPTSGIDPAGVQEFMDLIRQLSREEGLNVLVSSHNLRELEDVCDHVGIMNHGKVIIERSLFDLHGNISKIQVACQTGMPKLPKEFEVLHMSNSGRVYTMIVKGNPRKVAAAIQTEGDHLAIVDILPLTLEEIFIYEMGGLGYEVKDILF